jgi:uncharacterized DUF497 family protein
MEFEWDESTRQRNLIKHGIDFALAVTLFDGRPQWTTRSTYPDEERYLSIGIVEDRFIIVVWTQRGEAIRLISARRTRNDEKRAYRALYE